MAALVIAYMSPIQQRARLVGPAKNTECCVPIFIQVSATPQEKTL